MLAPVGQRSRAGPKTQRPTRTCTGATLGPVAQVEAGSPLPPQYKTENLELVRAGVQNLAAHINNVRTHGVVPVVAINRFATDTDAEVELVAQLAKQAGAFDAVSATHFADGGAGAVELARAVMRACDSASPEEHFKHLYDAKKDSIKQKIEAVVTKVYGGDGANYTEKAEAQIQRSVAPPPRLPILPPHPDPASPAAASCYIYVYIYIYI